MSSVNYAKLPAAFRQRVTEKEWRSGYAPARHEVARSLRRLPDDEDAVITYQRGAVVPQQAVDYSKQVFEPRSASAPQPAIPFSTTGFI